VTLTGPQDDQVEHHLAKHQSSGRLGLRDVAESHVVNTVPKVPQWPGVLGSPSV